MVKETDEKSAGSAGQEAKRRRWSRADEACFVEAIQQMSSAIQSLSMTFGRVASVLQEHTTHIITHSVDPIPLRRQKAIRQLLEEGLEDHEVVAIIKHFQSDIAIADSYLAITKDSIRKLFLANYSK
jgi:hypothetical protein